MKLFSLGDVKLPGSNNAKKKKEKQTKKSNNWCWRKLIIHATLLLLRIFRIDARTQICKFPRHCNVSIYISFFEEAIKISNTIQIKIKFSF